ncbi:amidohydrolase family protein [Herbaspirillum sp. NPDC087042]|uniref:amidohydrolase family protein n=1 Tax=Herbaspirillum sp. NPDC087042 TaxID=3364004 RepID=UPI00380DD419
MNHNDGHRRHFLKGAGATALAMAGASMFNERAHAASQGTAFPDADAQASVPLLKVAAGSCDCHVHIFDPQRYPYTPRRTYTPATASVAMLERFQKKLGMDRVVLVQPSGYGADNRCLVESLQRLGARARGVAVIDPSTVTLPELEQLHQVGVRGIRLNLEVKGETNVQVAADALAAAEKAVLPLGWAIQIYADTRVIVALAPRLLAMKSPVILDHFGGIKTRDGINDAAFGKLLQILRAGNVYVKLSAPYRASRQAPDYADILPFAQALVAAAPHRMVWASDWPHTGSASKRSGDLTQVEAFRAEDAGHTLDLLARWVPDETTRHQILVDNAAALFDFPRQP